MSEIFPLRFMNRMRETFAHEGRPEEAEAFFDALQNPPTPCLRLNRLKLVTEEDCQSFLEALRRRYGLPAWEPVAWTQEAWYLPPDWQPGRTVEFLQGLFYLQEASATLPATVLKAEPGARVLDLCAAPGGKSTKLLSDMHDEGVLVCNELHLERARVLLRNLEQWGADRAVVTHAEAQSLAPSFPEFFDKILVDAPCSGEGMFARDPQAVAGWEAYATGEIVQIQKEILEAAVSMLRPGGELLYSTCTFAEEENEAQIAALLERHPELSQLDASTRVPPVGLQELRPGMGGEIGSKCLRVWPQHARGEGHFCALLRKEGALVKSENALKAETLQATASVTPIRKRRAFAEAGRELPDTALFTEAFRDFARVHMTDEGYEYWSRRLNTDALGEREYLHAQPAGLPPMSGIHVLQRGLLLGSCRRLGKSEAAGPRGRRPAKGGRPESGGSVRVSWKPSHAFALALTPEQYRACLSLKRRDSRVNAYLCGQTLALEPEELEQLQPYRYVLLLVENHPLGFAQLSGGGLKNLLPASWVRPRTESLLEEKTEE